MGTLLVGFDSAWTASNKGAMAGCVRSCDGSFRDLGEPRTADFGDAGEAIAEWQSKEGAARTLVLLDQPTIVPNSTGQRVVDHLVSSPVSRRHGGMQPANTGKADMFGPDAPLWPFLKKFGGAADLLEDTDGTLVVETYPVFTIIAKGWVLEDPRPCGRLPKYNPGRRKTFRFSDWAYVCGMVSAEFEGRQLARLAGWVNAVQDLPRPTKSDQDKLDACLCLLVALYLAEGRECLLVGNHATGYIVVPQSEPLYSELQTRCLKTGRSPSEWLHVFTLAGAAAAG